MARSIFPGAALWFRWISPLALLSAPLLFAQDIDGKNKEKAAVSKIIQVSVYPDTALVTREVILPQEKGFYELVISPLPPTVVADSLYGEGSDGIRVLATRFRSRAVESDTRKEVRDLNDQEEKIQLENLRLASEAKTIEANASFLSKMEAFVAASTTHATEKGKIDSKEITKLTEYVMDLRRAQNKQSHENAIQQQDNTKKLAFLKVKRSELASGTNRKERDAVLVVERTEAGKGNARLSYLVDAASWKPQYRLRSGTDAKAITKMEYLAAITQQTGEDWNGVKLVLSNAQPMLNAAPPDLKSLAVAVTPIPGVPMLPTPASGPGGRANATGGQGIPVPGQTSQQLSGNANFNRDNLKKALEGRAEQLEVANPGGAQSINELEEGARALRFKAQNDFNKNSLDTGNTSIWNYAGALDQARELILSGEEKSQGKPIATSGDGPTITYRLEGETTISSRNDEQVLEVARFDLPSEIYFKALPVLTPNVYRQASLVNSSNFVLLPGVATMYHRGDFVGRMRLPLVAVGETFIAGFGAEPQLQVQRNLMEKTRTTQGGNQVLKYDYRILVSSYLKEKARLQVWDRLPLAEGETVSVTLGKSAPELSKNALYLREDRPKNLLRWDLELEPGQYGEKALKVDYEFKMELDKKMTIGSFSSK